MLLAQRGPTFEEALTWAKTVPVVSATAISDRVHPDCEIRRMVAELFGHHPSPLSVEIHEFLRIESGALHKLSN